MALRELVTGSDVCTPGDGAGPSNAAGSLADTLLGRSSKAQERLRDLPGLQGLAGPSSSAYGRGFSPDAVAKAAAEEEVIAVPGIAPNGFAVEEFLAGQHWPQQAAPPPQFAEFDRIFQQGQLDRPPGPMFMPPGQGPPAPLMPFLHAFMESAKMHTRFQPLPMPKVPLSVEDQCRIRDRSTIMARHMFADRGDVFADEQVASLLESLHINPRQLPMAGPPGQAGWDTIFAGGQPQLPQPSLSADVAAGSRAAAAAPVNGWVEDFGRLGVRELGEDWAGEYAQRGAGRPAAWADEFAEAAGPRNEWADEFRATQDAAAGRASQRDVNGGDALRETRALANTLAADKDGKFANSKFLQFVSKMSRGEIILEDNQAKERPPSAMGQAWGDEFAQRLNGAANGASSFEEVWREQGEASHWANEYAAEGVGPDTWADEFAERAVPDAEVNSWMEEWQCQVEGAAAAGAEGYVFKSDNPFLQDADSFAKGKELFRHGLLSEAVLALEAEAQRSPGNVEAWRLLGTVHAENDDDPQAIAALNKALAVAPGHGEVLLSLGVSHTNELDQQRALAFLGTWLQGQPAFAQVARELAAPLDSSQRMRHTIRVFEKAAAQATGNADIHVAVGVLHSLARNYEAAGTAFRAALHLRPQDYSLWNKLGATLANSSHSAEAISAYQKALELKPNYMRAWTNMGISQANVGNYEVSARYYVRALALNPGAAPVWGYLRTSLACSGRMDLMPAVDDSDLSTLQAALPL